MALDSGDGGVDIVSVDVTAVQQTAGHVLAVPGVALDHLVGRLEAHVGDGRSGEITVVGLGRGYDGGVGD